MVDCWAPMGNKRKMCFPRTQRRIVSSLHCISLLGGLEQAANSVDRNSKKSTETLDHWKLLNSCEILSAQSSHCIEKCADRLIVNV